MFIPNADVPEHTILPKWNHSSNWKRVLRGVKPSENVVKIFHPLTTDKKFPILVDYRDDPVSSFIFRHFPVKIAASQQFQSNAFSNRS